MLIRSFHTDVICVMPWISMNSLSFTSLSICLQAPNAYGQILTTFVTPIDWIRIQSIVFGKCASFRYNHGAFLVFVFPAVAISIVQHGSKRRDGT